MKVENKLINNVNSINVEQINSIKEDEFDAIYGPESSKKFKHYNIITL